MGIPNVGAGQVAINFGMTGPNFATVSACATGGHAIGEASEIIRRGDADIMLAGGSEAGIYEPLVGGFAAMRALSTRNDDPERGLAAVRRAAATGSSSARAPACVVLEELEHAEARGATILAELVGYGATADASHITLPGAGRDRRRPGARRALEKAGLAPADIDHVNAHATSTPEGDKAELQAHPDDLRRPRRRRRRSPPTSRCSATPSARPGRSRRSSRSWRCATAASRRRSTSTTPTRTREGLDLTPERARDAATIRAALSNSFGFGGQNTALVFRRWDG